jgi:hypothetical protein
MMNQAFAMGTRSERNLCSLHGNRSSRPSSNHAVGLANTRVDDFQCCCNIVHRADSQGQTPGLQRQGRKQMQSEFDAVSIPRDHRRYSSINPSLSVYLAFILPVILSGRHGPSLRAGPHRTAQEQRQPNHNHKKGMIV